MKFRFSSALLLALILTAPAPAAPLACYRTGLATELDHDGTVVWTRDGTLHPVYTVTGGRFSGAPVLAEGLSSAAQWWDGEFYGGLRLPPGTAPGVYTVDVGRGAELQLSVVAPPVRKATTVAAGRSLQTLRNAVAAGFRDITLAPGLHEWDGSVSLPAWTRLWGYHATVRRLPGEPDPFVPSSPREYNNRSIVPTGPNVSVYGLTLVYEVPGSVFHCPADAHQPGLVVADCKFERCNFGEGPTDVLVRDSTFYRAGCTRAPPGLYLNCLFDGVFKGGHAWQSWEGSGRTALIDCTFRETDRGPCWRFDTTITDHLAVGTKLIGIAHGLNDSESFSAEGTIARFLILHTRSVGCLGSSLQWDWRAEDCYVRDFYADGGRGFRIGSPWTPPTGKEFTGNLIESFTLKNGADIEEGPAAKGRTVYKEGTVEKK